MTEHSAPSGLLVAPTTDAQQGPRRGSRGAAPSGEMEAGGSKGPGLRKPDVPGPWSQLSASEVGRVPGPQRAGPLLFVLLLSPQIRGTSCPGKSSFCFCGQGAESSAGLRDPRRGAVPCCGACRDWGAAGAGASAIPSHGPASQDRLPVPAAQGVSRHFPLVIKVPVVSAAAVRT